jgi:hypothetical protein
VRPFSNWLKEDGLPVPDYFWMGTRITRAKDVQCLDDLLRIGTNTTTRFLLLMPQIEPIDLGRWLPKLDWVIQAGGSSAFDLAWCRALREQCRNANIPYFLSHLGARAVENGRRLRFADERGCNWSEWEEVLRVRQMPNERTIQNPQQRLQGSQENSAAAPESPKPSLVTLEPNPDGEAPWPELVDKMTIVYPSFPVDVLADWHEAYVTDVAKLTHMSIDAAATGSLSILGGASAKRVRVSFSPDGNDNHPVAIWTCVLSPTGTGKSPLIERLTRPMEVAQSKLRKTWLAEDTARRVQRDITQRRYDRLAQNCANATDKTEIIELKSKMIELQAEIVGLERREGQRLIVDDMTGEALVQLLAENQGALLATSDEASRFLSNLIRSSPAGIASFEAVLKSHSATNIYVDRSSHAPVIIHEPVLSLALATQNRTFSRFLTNDAYSGRGLWERILVVQSPTLAGKRSGAPASAAPAAHQEYDHKIAELLALPRFDCHLKDPSTVELRLWKARGFAKDILEGYDRRMAHGEDLSGDAILGWANKLRTNLFRIAGLIWLTENEVTASSSSIEIPISVVERAAKLCDYFIGHAKLVYIRTESALEGDVEAVMERLRGRPVFRVRDIQRAFGSIFRERRQLDPVLAALEQRHAIRPLTPTSRLGRPPEEYAVHPALRLATPNK